MSINKLHHSTERALVASDLPGTSMEVREKNGIYVIKLTNVDRGVVISHTYTIKDSVIKSFNPVHLDVYLAMVMVNFSYKVNRGAGIPTQEEGEWSMR